ncbi:hypothetical protein VIGAN_02030500, partial [Vigna angularis var. angularis]
KIMTSKILLKLIKIVVVVTIGMYAIISTSSTTLISSSSTPEQLNDMDEGDGFYDADDYGIWNPSTGYWGIGHGAPIPHPQHKQKLP